MWPFAVKYAVWIINNLPDDDGLSPIEKFTRQKFENYNHLRRSHVWGAPMYVLDPSLQDGKKLPKFHARSRQGKFVGFSKHHSSNVALVLNRATGAISPQYHVVFDDYFQTVRGATDTADVDLNTINWENFITPVNSERYYDESDTAHPPPALHQDWNIGASVDQTSEGVISEVVMPIVQPVVCPSARPVRPSQVKFEFPPVATEGVPLPVSPSEGAIADPHSTSAVAKGELPHAEPAIIPTVEVEPVPSDPPDSAC